ncbi:hypothetical protein ZIOFF_014441 [Zingiber officinale]|uniref:J domain-containing protein n=1 Tax=Zingiber officinale TaxID=94328 RepID=A0A8J5HQ37_ZINOF|nr:hypothetical protein ZIOFF_014441 [Zingiber officinale]
MHHGGRTVVISSISGPFRNSVSGQEKKSRSLSSLEASLVFLKRLFLSPQLREDIYLALNPSPLLPSHALAHADGSIDLDFDLSAAMDASPAGSDAAASSSCYYSLLGIRRDAYHSEIRAAYRRLALVNLSPRPFDFVLKPGRVCDFEAGLGSGGTRTDGRRSQRPRPARRSGDSSGFRKPTPVSACCGFLVVATLSGWLANSGDYVGDVSAVLSDTSKRAIYDAGLYDPLDDDDQVLPKRKYGIPSKNVVFFTLIFGWDAQGFADFMQEIMATMERLKPEKPETLEDLQRMLGEIMNMGSSIGGANAGGRREPSDAAWRSRSGGPTRRR